MLIIYRLSFSYANPSFTIVKANWQMKKPVPKVHSCRELARPLSHWIFPPPVSHAQFFSKPAMLGEERRSIIFLMRGCVKTRNWHSTPCFDGFLNSAGWKNQVQTWTVLFWSSFFFRRGLKIREKAALKAKKVVKLTSECFFEWPGTSRDQLWMRLCSGISSR